MALGSSAEDVLCVVVSFESSRQQLKGHVSAHRLLCMLELP